MKLNFPALTAVLFAATASAASAQMQMPRLPVIFSLGQGQPGPPPGAPMQAPPDVLQRMLFAASGSDSIYFSPRGYTINANAVATLSAQARWLVANPMVQVRLEGHGDPRDTRDYALAIGNRRASAVRDFLVLQGVAPNRITVVSWGKERPGSVRVGPSVVAAGPRVVTKVQ